MSDYVVSAIKQLRNRIEAVALLTLSPGERLVAWAILLHCDAAGECWPGTATLRRLTGLNSRTIKRIRPRLLIAFDYAPGGSRKGAKRTSSRYRFLLDRGYPATSQAAQPVPREPADGGPDATSTGGVVPPEPGVSDHPKVQQGPSEGPAGHERTDTGALIRSLIGSTTPPWPRRATL